MRVVAYRKISVIEIRKKRCLVEFRCWAENITSIARFALETEYSSVDAGSSIGSSDSIALIWGKDELVLSCTVWTTGLMVFAGFYHEQTLSSHSIPGHNEGNTCRGSPLLPLSLCITSLVFSWPFLWLFWFSTTLYMKKLPELKWPCLIRSPFHSQIWRDAREQFQHFFPLASQSELAKWSDQET